MIAAVKIKWPSKTILIGKMDMDAVYRHIHTNTRIASTRIFIVDNLAFLCLLLPFITTLSLVEYTTVRKAAIDLGNDLIRDKLLVDT